MEVSKISALVRFGQRTMKMATRLVAEAEALGIEVPKRKKRKAKAGDAVAPKVRKPRAAKAGPSSATEEE